MKIQQVTILGATGSIGRSTLEVLALHPEKFQIFALTANVQNELLFELCKKWQPRYAVLRDAVAAHTFQKQLANSFLDTQLLVGEEALCQVAVAEQVDIVVAAIVGAAGLPSSFAAVQAGKRILLANKEALVMAGDLFMQAAYQNAACLLPIDSEHNAIFQCLPDHYVCGQTLKDVNRILLTASGGPFRERAIASLKYVTVEEACAHPNWDMGKKISVDSATMMNKGLELIEACHLFACTPDKIELLVHPQSIVHSMVEFCDGSIIAQMGSPDMRTPIAHALAWPQRFKSGVGSLDLIKNAHLNFEPVDFARFPCLKLALDVAKQGQAASIVLNAANEVAVAGFLDKTIAFTDIAIIIEEVLNASDFVEPENLAQVKAQDLRARDMSLQTIAQLRH